MIQRKHLSSASQWLAVGAIAWGGPGLWGGRAMAQSAGDAPSPDAVAPQVANSRYQFEGVINQSDVFVRSGPDDKQFNPTQRLDKGTKVTVVGIKFDWLKIVPPDGSFCYVPKLFIVKRGDGSVGRNTKPDNLVRAGSSQNDMVGNVLCKLNVGDDVQILGEHAQFFKIKPPADAYFYVNKQFVDPVRAIRPEGAAADNTAAAAPADNSAAAATTAAPPAGDNAAVPPSPSTGGSSSEALAAGGPTTTPTTEPSSGMAAAPAATQPADAVAKAEADFDAAEARYAEVSKLPLDEQPVEELHAQYDAVAKSKLLPDGLQRVADLRAATLAVRTDSKAKLIAVKATQKAAAEKALALQAEQQELQERLRSQDIQMYAAVGTLQASSLQQGAATLYRLTDPGTGRTMVYLRSTDPKLVPLLGQFVGVKGDAVTDAQLNLRMITPTDVQAVDVNKLNTTVAATIIPPSLMTKNITASTGNQ